MALNYSGQSFIRISFRPLDFVLQDRTFEPAAKARSKINRHHFKQKQYRYFPAHPSFKPCLFLFQGKDGSRKASAPSREKIIAENIQPSHALGFFHALNAMIFSAAHDMPFSASPSSLTACLFLLSGWAEKIGNRREKLRLRSGFVRVLAGNLRNTVRNIFFASVLC